MSIDNAPLTITLDAVMSDYDGQLARLALTQKDSRNFLITWQVEMEVKSSEKQAFFVAVAVCFAPGQDDEVRDIADQLCPSGKTPIFAFIPAYSFGSKDFGIFIAENNLGEILVNGLVNEVIEQAGIEEAVTNQAAIKT
ncbi:MAG: hypothetical protein ACON5P_01070 [Candidatus Puniceispirillaceae bacterium]